ncbi:hypothetical protein RSOL_362080 [Rhizoctonia solani AG-3 Rhs1AP]|uniref:Uncharacterized protein n=1 Tax=Rhizoctonia solani AG-3 Rhs1AP TaxID=1086054 RepID=X8JAH8_9AGAM|nr:hypothetical protein RSOL_362080 [Rhizoctonia solani AG-3 Rhs1AP]
MLYASNRVPSACSSPPVCLISPAAYKPDQLRARPGLGNRSSTCCTAQMLLT